MDAADESLHEPRSPANAEARRSGRLWLAGAVLVSAVYSLVAVVLPARGLTFLWTDWEMLSGLATGRWPGTWLSFQDAHFMPLGMALFDLERRLFGGDHDLYLYFAWVCHVATVALLGALLRAWTGDARAAAIATAAFGVAVTYRLSLWWAAGGFFYLGTGLVMGALLALHRSREGSRAWFAAALAAVFLAPCAYGTGIAAGPAAAAEVLFLFPKPRRRKLVAIVVAFGAWAALYACLRWLVFPGTVVPASVRPRSVALFLAEALGLGFVRQVPLLPVPEEPVFAVALSLGYLAVLAVAAYALDAPSRARLLFVHLVFLAFFGPVALARSRLVEGRILTATASQYQLFAALTWTPTLALLLAAALRRAPRATMAGAAVVLVALGWGHARSTADDPRPYCPRIRRELRSREFADSLVAVAREARGPLYDLELPPILSLTAIRASEALPVLAPELHPAWTRERTPESIAPYRDYPVLRERIEDR